MSPVGDAACHQEGVRAIAVCVTTIGDSACHQVRVGVKLCWHNFEHNSSVEA